MNKSRIIVVAVVVAIAIGYYFYNLIGQDEVVEEPEEIEGFDEFDPFIILDEMGNAIEQDEIPIEERFPIDMPEHAMQNFIHWMSHAFVFANEKWGTLLPSEQNINRLLEVAIENRHKYKHGERYVQILQRWSEGDFNNSVADHNLIWELQGGTIGKALRIMNKEEMKQYWERQFEKTP